MRAKPIVREIEDSIDLFNSRLHRTYLADKDRTVSDEEDYYKLLQKNYDFLDSVARYCDPKFGKGLENHALYFGDHGTKDAVALVTTTKLVPGCPARVSVGTYFDNDGKVMIVNRFDPCGRQHENKMKVYGNLSYEEYEFYKKYLSDNEVCDEKGCHYKVSVPHIHFHTQSQTKMLGNQTMANAISIEGLIRYLDDLMADNDPKSLINNLNIGMPFLDYKQNKSSYLPIMYKKAWELYKEVCRYEELTSGIGGHGKEILDIMNSFIELKDEAYFALTEDRKKYICLMVANFKSLNSLSFVELQFAHKRLLENYRMCADNRVYYEKFDRYLNYVNGLCNISAVKEDFKDYLYLYRHFKETKHYDELIYFSNMLIKNLFNGKVFVDEDNQNVDNQNF